MSSGRFDLTEARVNAGLSIRGLSDKTGVSYPTLARLEAGGTVHPANAKKVADYFGVKVTDLMPLEREAA